MRVACVHLHPPKEAEVLPDSIRVVQLILVQLVLVRIQVGQHRGRNQRPFSLKSPHIVLTKFPFALISLSAGVTINGLRLYP